MHMGQGARHLLDHQQRPHRRRAPVVSHRGRKVAAIDQLHRHERVAALLARLDHFDDVAMVK